ncbi:hypothetical protein [Paraburkholderia dipogonis]|uniref:hypothetical protein n=1 Tax=Paraburkholderia dipogonis TaxID=1211383 RepID=UPI0038B7593F
MKTQFRIENPDDVQMTLKVTMTARESIALGSAKRSAGLSVGREPLGFGNRVSARRQSGRRAMLGRISRRVADTHRAVVHLLRCLPEVFKNLNIVGRQSRRMLLPSRLNNTDGFHDRMTEGSYHRQLPFVLDALPAPGQARKQIRNFVVVNRDEINYARLGIHEFVQYPQDVTAQPREFRAEQISGFFFICIAACDIAAMLFTRDPRRAKYGGDRTDSLNPRRNVSRVPAPRGSCQRRCSKTNKQCRYKAESYFRPLPNSFHFLSPNFRGIVA